MRGDKLVAMCFASSKGIRIQDFRKILPVGNGIPGFGVRNTAPGFPESKFLRQRPGMHGVEFRIQDPGGTSLHDLYVDVSLDRVWFWSSLSLTGYIILRQSVLNRVIKLRVLS